MRLQTDRARRPAADELAVVGLGLVARVAGGSVAAGAGTGGARGRRVAEDGGEDLELVVDLCKGRAVGRVGLANRRQRTNQCGS